MAATLATSTMVSPSCTVTAPSACLANLPVSMESCLSPIWVITFSGITGNPAGKEKLQSTPGEQVLNEITRSRRESFSANGLVESPLPVRAGWAEGDGAQFTCCPWINLLAVALTWLSVAQEEKAKRASRPSSRKRTVAAGH